MKKFERDEIANISVNYRPIGAWTYFGLSILYAIPLIGFIVLIIHAIGAQNINMRSYARSYFCGIVLILLLILFSSLIGIGGTTLAALLSNLKGIK